MDEQHLIEALEVAAWRFDDLRAIIRSQGSYDNAGFCEASADRCRAAIRDFLIAGRSAIAQDAQNESEQSRTNQSRAD